VRPYLTDNSPEGPQKAKQFEPALAFATEQLAPRAPTDPRYQRALEDTMALMVWPVDKLPAAQKELLDKKLRIKVASDINKAILESRGERAEAKIRSLVRARAWAEAQAREVNVDLPRDIALGLDSSPAGDSDAVMT
jgi:glucose-induced degradation protein 8